MINLHFARTASLSTALALVFALFSVQGFAQNDITADADAAFDRGGYFEAAKDYQAAYAKLKGDLDEKGRVCFLIGECYRLSRALPAAEEWYKRAIDLKWAADNPEVFKNYGLVYMGQGEFDDAVEQFEKYKSNGGDAELADTYIMSCNGAAESLIMGDSRFVVEPLVMVNSPSFDFAMAFADKRGEQVIFASSRSSATGSGEDPITGESYMDLFSAEVDRKGKWSIPEPLGNTINSPSNEGGVTLDAKFKTLYFTRCLVDKDNNFPCDIYTATRTGNRWGAAEELGILDREAGDDSSQVGQPALTPDDQFLVFVSDMQGGQGGRDLWYIQWDDASMEWGAPTNMGPSINSPSDEFFPHIRSNGDLYFATDRPGGMGGLDIMSATWKGDGMNFEAPAFMEYPINTASDDFALVYHPKEDKGYLSSDRPESKGKDDVFAFSMPPLEFAYVPYVYDYDTGMPIVGATVTVTGSDGESVTATTDDEGGAEDGRWTISPESTYSVDINMEGYISAGDQFSTVGLSKSTNFVKEYLLKEVVTNEDYPMPLVQYVFDAADLVVNAETNSKDSLDYLVDLLERNPTFVISLEAHTDTRGGDQYNEELSQRRAETCVNYLVESGIDRQRLQPLGRGESIPLISDAEIAALATEDEREAAHQMNRRTVFRITSFDFVPE
jgi:peptidoglycan-associated lipoprotein